MNAGVGMGLSFEDIIKTGGAFLAANLAGDTIQRMVNITAMENAETYQTLQHKWETSIHDKRNDVARSYNSSTISQILDYKKIHPDVFADYFNAVRDKSGSGEGQTINRIIDEIIELQEKAFLNEEKDAQPFYELGSLLLQVSRGKSREGKRWENMDFSIFNDTKFQTMAEGFVDNQPYELQPGDYNISNLKHYLPKKDRYSRFFNELEDLPEDLKQAMSLSEQERLDYKLIYDVKEFDANLSAVQWEMNIIEGWNYGYLAFAAVAAEYITPEEHATGDYAVKAKTGDDASQLALYDPELDKKYTEMYLKDLRDNGATKDDIALAMAGLEHAKTVRDLAGNILVQDGLGGNAAWRTNQANSQIMGAQGQKPIMLARGQIIGNGGFLRMEDAMAKLIESLNSIEKGNPNKQGEKSPWIKSQTRIYDNDGNVVKVVTPKDLLRDGEIYNNAEKFYDLHLKRSDKNNTRFFRHDYVQKALDRMIVEDSGFEADLTGLADKINEMHRAATLDKRGRTKVGYKSLDELISEAVEQEYGDHHNLDSTNRTRLSAEEQQQYSPDYLGRTIRETFEQELLDGVNRGQDWALKVLAKVAPEAVKDLAAEQNRDIVEQRKHEIINSIKDNPDREVKFNGQQKTTFLKELPVAMLK